MPFQESLKDGINRQEQYETSFKFLSQLLSSVTQSVIVCDLEGTIVYWNDASEKMYGWTSWEAIGENIVILAPSPQFVKKVDEIAEYLKKGESISNEVLALRKDGSTFPIYLNNSPMRDENGKIIGMIGIASDNSERKHIEEELRIQQTFFEQMFTQSNISTQILDKDGWCERINPKLSQLFGVEPQHIEGKVYNIFKDEEVIRDGIDKHLEKVFKEGKIVEWEVNFDIGIASESQNIKVQEKKKAWFSNWSYPIFDESGNLSHVVIQHTDISDRKHVEEELLEAKEQFELIFNTSPDISLISRFEDGCIVNVNDLFSTVTGYTRDEAIGKTTIGLDVWNNTDDRIKMIDAFNEKGFCENLEILFKKKNGSTFFGLMSAKIITLQGVPHIYALVRDITERKHADEKLRVLSQAVEQSSAAIVITDIHSSITYVNKKFIELTGYSYDEAIGKNPRILKSNLMDDKIYKELYDIILAGKEWRGEFHNKKKNGELFWESALISPVRDSFGNIIQFLAVKEDITIRKKEEAELKLLNEKLKISNEAIEENLILKNALIEELTSTKEELELINSQKDKFFSIIAHDLKSPFQGFLGLTKIMAEDMQSLTMKELIDFGEIMQSAAINLYKLLENLLDWSRMQRGATEFNPESIMLSYILKHNIEVLAEFAKQKDITLVNSIPENTQIMADIPMLNTVIRNLISNAIKFTPRNGKIEIGIVFAQVCIDMSTCHETSDFYIFVKDNGIGMDENRIKKLFKIDEKVSRPGTEGESSTGLGLLLCKEFIEKHGGKLWVESEVGKGSTFYFTLKSDHIIAY